MSFWQFILIVLNSCHWHFPSSSWSRCRWNNQSGVRRCLQRSHHQRQQPLRLHPRWKELLQRQWHTNYFIIYNYYCQITFFNLKKKKNDYLLNIGWLWRPSVVHQQRRLQPGGRCQFRIEPRMRTWNSRRIRPPFQLLRLDFLRHRLGHLKLRHSTALYHDFWHDFFDGICSAVKNKNSYLNVTIDSMSGAHLFRLPD